jgi:hypothetical protein
MTVGDHDSNDRGKSGGPLPAGGPPEGNLKSESRSLTPSESESQAVSLIQPSMVPQPVPRPPAAR